MNQETVTLPQLDVPEWLVALLWINVVIFVAWLVLTVLVRMRRSASNLTPAGSAKADKEARPDFLSVDRKAREAQIRRGDAFEKELEKREAKEAAGARGDPSPASFWKRIAGIATMLVSIFTLLSTLIGVIFQVDRIGQTLSQADKIGLLLQRYPIPFAVCAFVIGYYIVNFFLRKQWKFT